MGVYQYTMRKDVKEVDNMKVGRFAFSYKHGRDWQPGGETGIYRNGKNISNRLVLLAEAHAKKAREKLPDIEYVVIADSFKDAARYELPVYVVPQDMYQFTEELYDAPVGFLILKDKKFSFRPITA